MAQRELSILANARITLNDTNTDNQRWSDERLMQLLSDGQDDMCKSIPIIASKATINTVVGQDVYRLPGDSIKLLRASSEGIPLSLTSYDEIEDAKPDWEEDKSSTYSAIIVNALSQQEIRPYPLVSTSKPIKVRYHARPVVLGWDSTTKDCMEELTISDMWDDGLKQYVIGMAFLDYGDEASNSRASTALGIYKGEYNKASNLAKNAFSKRLRVTHFQGKVSHRSDIGGNYAGSNCRSGY